MKRSIPFAKLSLLEVASSRALFGGTFLMLAVIVGTASLMWLEFRRTEAQDRKQLELLASVMESHASQVFDNTKLALDSLAKNLTTENHTPAQLEAQQSYRLQGLPFLRSIAIVSSEGLVLASTTASDRGGLGADRTSHACVLAQCPRKRSCAT